MFVRSLRRGLLCLSSHSTIPNPSPLPIPPLVLLRFLSVRPSEDSPTISLLIKSLGFSPETALSVYTKLPNKNPRDADSVISFLKSRDFSAAQISEMVRRFPSILGLNPERILLPKLEFFLSKGLSGPKLTEFLSLHPYIFWRSLEKYIIPDFNFFRGVLNSDVKALQVILRASRAGAHAITAAPNVKYLVESGLPGTKVAALLHYHSHVFFTSPARFRKAVKVVEEMGFDPTKTVFFHALKIMLTMKESNWESKSTIFRDWGWSEKELVSAFKKYPLCMANSEDKINRAMSFYVNSLGCKPSLIAKYPALLSHSLEKRIIPRAAVLDFLLSKGLVGKHLKLAVFIVMSEKEFMKKILRYQGEVPHILALYQQELNRLR
ncbi:uncharacterized protein LOC116192497 [Punica granatum]|uniref:Uncharacterized protein n=2 Tax=Punica granatum TaxID=22663 RepID=A0A218WEE8_PUNGR|nr:uncharacterized protein LOC116192497 [Punica granatum]OWM71224.1 hypothetical protein CDL15_Pgr011351 [Punica granatum]PKI65080.1 hypothetical protein CRG98_014549 [Punica granatum]